MSLEDLKEYARRCSTDPVIREEAKRIGLGDDSIEDHIRLAETHGLNWSMEDMQAFTLELLDDDMVELDEAELEKVAGGVTFVTAIVIAVVGAAVAAAAAAVVVAGVTGATSAAVSAGSGTPNDW